MKTHELPGGGTRTLAPHELDPAHAHAEEHRADHLQDQAGQVAGPRERSPPGCIHVNAIALTFCPQFTSPGAKSVLYFKQPIGM